MNSDFEPYHPNNIALFEAIYGKDLISIGGLAAIDNMFSGLDVKGVKALDIGFGLGGVAYYLADAYQMDVSGVEIHPWMVEYAKTKAPKLIADQLNFDVYTQDGEIPFTNQSFDLIYSKGVLNHVKDKDRLFRQIYKLMKKDGLFVIADWIYPEAELKLEGPLVKETQTSYQKILQRAGFKEINFRDDSEVFTTYVASLIQNITRKTEWISKNYGTEIYTMILDDHNKLITDLKQKIKFAVRIVAKK